MFQFGITFLHLIITGPYCNILFDSLLFKTRRAVKAIFCIQTAVKEGRFVLALFFLHGEFLMFL